MFRMCKIAAVAAALTVAGGAALADEPARTADFDRVMTFAIPAEAMQAYVDTLTEKSDFTVFVDRDCPTELQQMALRKLWKLLPVAKTDSPFS